VRKPGHKGVCTAAPSAATLDWDEHYHEQRARLIEAATIIDYLDWPAPPWADLLDG